MRGLTGDELLRLPVRLRGITLGRPVDLILHPTAPRVPIEELVLEDERGWRRVPVDRNGLPEGGAGEAADPPDGC